MDAGYLVKEKHFSSGLKSGVVILGGLSMYDTGFIHIIKLTWCVQLKM